MKRKPPPHLRADTAQRAAVRAELHTYVDRAVDDWAHIEAEASDGISRGGGDGVVRTSEVADPTSTAALNAHHDPAGAWLDRFRRLRVEMRLLDARRADLMPAKPKRGRVNEVENCTLCGMPAPQVRRVDGQPYCPKSCFYRVWRTKAQTV